jgi:hypothetical protein
MGFDAGHERGGRCPQRVTQAEDHVERRRFAAVFELRDVGAVHIRAEGQSLLSKAGGASGVAQLLAEHFASVAACVAGICGL